MSKFTDALRKATSRADVLELCDKEDDKKTIKNTCYCMAVIGKHDKSWHRRGK